MVGFKSFLHQNVFFTKTELQLVWKMLQTAWAVISARQVTLNYKTSTQLSLDGSI
jgi:hypothetical protein